MNIGISNTPPSRANAQQISAFLAPELIEAARQYRSRENLTQQEVMAMAINTAVAHFGKKPFLSVKRERLVKRKKSLAKVQKDLQGIRKDTQRMAAFFDTDDHQAVKIFAKEVGLRVEGLVKIGLQKILQMAPGDTTGNQTDWDWSKIETAKLPKNIGKERRGKQAA